MIRYWLTANACNAFQNWTGSFPHLSELETEVCQPGQKHPYLQSPPRDASHLSWQLESRISQVPLNSPCCYTLRDNLPFSRLILTLLTPTYFSLIKDTRL